MVALAGVSRGVGSASKAERTAIMASGIAGTAGLVAHPELLELHVDTQLRVLFAVAAVAFLASVLYGLWALLSRPAARRPAAFVTVYLMALLFFAPVFLFRSPYAAVAGLTVAHGYQYLLIVGMVAGAGSARSSLVSLAVLMNLGLLGGLALNAASHLHDGATAARALYGAYLGVVMAHFVIDAGLWRLRDEFPRQFLTRRLPYLLRPGRPSS